MEKDDFKKHESIVKLYQDVSTTGFLKIFFCLKKDIKEFNKYVYQYLIDNQGTELKAKTQLITKYCDKINQFYHEKSKSFFSIVFSTLIVLGTFLMVIASYLSLTK